MIATAATSSPTSIFACNLTTCPSIFTTLTDFPARLAIKAKLPSEDIDNPEGCKPTSNVSMSVDFSPLRAITNNLLSGVGFHLPSTFSHFTALVTKPILSSGVTCKLVGGPKREFDNGRFATDFGNSGSEISTMLIRS